MKKKQKINKAVNYGEWLLLGLMVLFLLFLFLIRDRPAPARGIGVRTSATRAPAPAIPDAGASQDAVPAPESDSDAASGSDSDAIPDAASESDSDADASESVPAHDDSGRVNINTAGLSELCALPGIGESLAGRIIDYRETHGPFARPEDVMRVAGIGQGKFAAMESLITV